MLTKFEVKNYAGFEKTITFDLTSKRKIDYNKNFVEKGIIKKALIYGPNGSGKSSLCMAIMDITYHLVDKEKMNIPNYKYFYCGCDQEIAEFTYWFKFDGKTVKYSYTKYAPTLLGFESLYINNDLVYEFNYMHQAHFVNKIEGAQNLNFNGITPQISGIKYIFKNTILPEKSVVSRLIKYVEGMLLFRSLTEGNNYVGFSNGSESLSSIVIRNNKVDDFKEFLMKQGLNYDLVKYTDQNNTENLGIRFANGKILPFNSIISSGTKTMWLFYCWMLEFNNVTLLIMDEFDAYYHYGTAQSILELTNSQNNMQTIITTHNIALMNNKVTRPDCCFIIDGNKIDSLFNLSKTEIRKKSNLQKLYMEGKFTNVLE